MKNGLYIDDKGNKYWYKDGLYHRTDGPAFERINGDKYWYIEGNLHRIDGPAVEWPDGYKSWWIDDKLHRTDGPAIEWANGDKSWYIDEVEYTERDYWKKLWELGYIDETEMLINLIDKP